MSLLQKAFSILGKTIAVFNSALGGTIKLKKHTCATDFNNHGFYTPYNFKCCKDGFEIANINREAVHVIGLFGDLCPIKANTFKDLLQESMKTEKEILVLSMSKDSESIEISLQTLTRYIEIFDTVVFVNGAQTKLYENTDIPDDSLQIQWEKLHKQAYFLCKTHNVRYFQFLEPANMCTKSTTLQKNLRSLQKHMLAFDLSTDVPITEKETVDHHKLINAITRYMTPILQESLCQANSHANHRDSNALTERFRGYYNTDISSNTLKELTVATIQKPPQLNSSLSTPLSMPPEREVMSEEILAVLEAQVLRQRASGLSQSNLFQGYLDCTSEGWVYGWVWSPLHPDLHIPVEIVSKEGTLGVAIANKYRNDLEAASIGNWHYAFHFEVPQTLNDGNLHYLYARVKGGSFYLSTEPLVYREPLAIAGKTPL